MIIRVAERLILLERMLAEKNAIAASPSEKIKLKARIFIFTFDIQGYS